MWDGAVCWEFRLSIKCGSLAAASQGLQCISHCQRLINLASDGQNQYRSQKGKGKKCEGKNAESTSILFRKLNDCQRKQKNNNKSEDDFLALH